MSFVATSAVLDPGTVNGKVGGQLVIVRAAWRTAVTNVVRDKAGLGGVLVIYLKTRRHTIAIANTYWPARTCETRVDSNSLYSKYKKWMREVGMHGDPIDYIRNTI